jgi:hypothetical protein
VFVCLCVSYQFLNAIFWILGRKLSVCVSCHRLGKCRNKKPVQHLEMRIWRKKKLFCLPWSALTNRTETADAFCGPPHCDLDGYRFQVTNPFGLTASSNCWHSSQNLQEYKNHSGDLTHESTQATTCVLQPIDPVHLHHTNYMYHLLKHSLSAQISHLYASPDLQYQHR